MWAVFIWLRKWQAFVSTLMNYMVPQKAELFFIGFSQRTRKYLVTTRPTLYK